MQPFYITVSSTATHSQKSVLTRVGAWPNLLPSLFDTRQVQQDMIARGTHRMEALLLWIFHVLPNLTFGLFDTRQSPAGHDCPAHPQEGDVAVWDFPIATRNGEWICLPNPGSLRSGGSCLRTRGLLSVGWRHSEQFNEQRMERYAGRSLRPC